jgi:hypothetical protein
MAAKITELLQTQNKELEDIIPTPFGVVEMLGIKASVKKNRIIWNV